MLAKKIVINASPLILLCNAGMVEILPKLFEEIVIPDAVWQEILASPREDKAARQLTEIAWLQKKAVTNHEEIVYWDLGEGETSTLSFAYQYREYYAMLDDRAAKRCALSLGIRTLGTGSVLILAKKQGLLHSVEQALFKLRNEGLWISDAVIRLLKQKAGE